MDIFEEIKEDLERERYSKLWQRYGYFLLVVAVIAIVGTSASVWWKGNLTKQQEATGNLFEQAIVSIRKNELDNALTLFDQLAKEEKGNVVTLALLKKAALLGQQGKNDEALALYDKIAASKESSHPFKELALLIASHLRLEAGKPVEKEIWKQLTKEDAIWRALALELQAAEALRDGKYSQAKEIFSTLANGEETPPAIRERASSMVATLEQ